MRKEKATIASKAREFHRDIWGSLRYFFAAPAVLIPIH
jgi:hypothetical protein